MKTLRKSVDTRTVSPSIYGYEGATDWVAIEWDIVDNQLVTTYECQEVDGNGSACTLDDITWEWSQVVFED